MTTSTATVDTEAQGGAVTQIAPARRMSQVLETADHKEATTQKIEAYKVSLFNTIAEVGIHTNPEGLRNGTLHTAFKRIEAELDGFRAAVLNLPTSR